MGLANYRDIENWTEDHLLLIPSQETDLYEYKSKGIAKNKDQLANAIQKAASAFWNSGGGFFIVGVAKENGKIDGGIPEQIGNQPVRDWVDGILLAVQPSGPYAIKTITPNNSNSKIQSDHIVLIIGFGESTNIPHMGYNNSYYVRAGARSEPVGHYVVEAHRARRGLSQPVLRGLIRVNEYKHSILELAIIPVTDVVALDVQISFDPIPPGFLHESRLFPLTIPLIDKNNPFRIDVATPFDWKILGDAPFNLKLKYKDLVGREFEDNQLINYMKQTPSSFIGIPDNQKFEKALSSIATQFTELNKLLHRYSNRFLNSDE